ncbi:hypothetical protein PHYBLDRAFT_162084 [Phycomyces blakesleeanus NRRL 1555(-)]|uniref:Uncharacterized protein n=1 Tax=Phycomyces blakesleeanus (strain ATCC 8743b / DSM 1359 / FGSC 10004 / NBRC 33097 / NRRL 1555) TaxID=763407 RepID=A0A162QAT3_PHYB8|nr:hypothetical protein PHYBLDRAFT_162084 [Phycomyces blakesleeanus NRRL 1555(-)]OAD81476.1 hypothetical protein PHYBLDRAFT_162084 [Phycomyces blakesleeanus NRRL 1555(-)]|eukprot:XP_018299516.1 hypothetical protein PHYBLDRAFT_162084 [Phycomyces blakesleeanus NRRL 1555(-)]
MYDGVTQNVQTSVFFLWGNLMDSLKVCDITHNKEFNGYTYYYFFGSGSDFAVILRLINSDYISGDWHLPPILHGKMVCPQRNTIYSMNQIDFFRAGKKATICGLTPGPLIYGIGNCKQSLYHSAGNADKEANYIGNLDYYCNIESKNETDSSYITAGLDVLSAYSTTVANMAI